MLKAFEMVMSIFLRLLYIFKEVVMTAAFAYLRFKCILQFAIGNAI